LATTLRHERPDYVYLKEIFRQLRAELGIVVPRTPKRLPYVPSEDEIRRYYETVWRTRKLGDLVLIKTLLYTGVRVSELWPSGSLTWTSTVAKSALMRAKVTRIASCRSRHHSRRLWRCTMIGCGNAEPASFSSRHGRSRTAIVASAASSSGMRRLQA